MLNHVVLVGRVLSYIELDDKTIKIQITVPRGKEGCDVVPIVLRGSLSNTFKEYCGKNALIGVKGTIRNEMDELYVLAINITFLSSKEEKSDTDE